MLFRSVDVNFIKNNNFNNNAYRNNFGNNNYRPYPANGNNSYGNSYDNSYSNNRSVSSDIEVMLKDFMSTQTTFNKTVEKLGKIDTLAAKVDSLAHDVEMLKIKAIPGVLERVKHSMLSKLKLIITLGCFLNFMRDGREKKEKLKLLNKIVLLE